MAPNPVKIEEDPIPCLNNMDIVTLPSHLPHHHDPTTRDNNNPVPRQSPSMSSSRSVSSSSTCSSSPVAVSVFNACKSYTSGSPVLNNFSMTVEEGTIYGLLGASGCGKTTILSCIVGIRALNSGNIFVFGHCPGTRESGIPGRGLGYMPQDIALYPSLSIKEVLEFFGRVYEMSQVDIMKRLEFLTQFLDLPHMDRRIRDLSGGQQRRVSLASCLLHEPPLLILDEPTVGVDPLLRESIWNYLCEMVSKKRTTVIITTHYIEEAKNCDKVGLMRNGKLLVEKSPESLLQEYQTVLLEDIVLKLCKNDEMGDSSSHQTNDDDAEIVAQLGESSFYDSTRRKMLKKSKSNKPHHHAIVTPSSKSKKMKQKEEEESSSVVGLKFSTLATDENQNRNRNGRDHTKVQIMSTSPIIKSPRGSLLRQTVEDTKSHLKRIRAVILRNFYTLFRNPVFMLAIFFMPSFQIVITNLTLGPEPKHLDFGIVNPEINHDLSKCDPRSLNKMNKTCGTQLLSCKYINTLPNDIISPVSVRTKEEALRDVKVGKLWGYMEFPSNYSKLLTDRGAAGIFSDNATLDGSTISFRMDHSNYFASALLMKSFYESFQTFVKSTLRDCDQDVKKGDVPLNFRPPVYGTFDVEFHDYIAPAVLVVITFIIPYLTCSVYNITDRKQGTLDRSMVAGVTIEDLLGAFLCTEGFLIMCQTMIAYLLVIFIFQMEIKGSVAGFLGITMMTGLSGLSFGFLIAQLVNEEMEALIIGVGFYCPNLILCGIIWPLEAAPLAIRIVSHCLPCTWAIQTVRNIISRGWPLSHRDVWSGFAFLSLWILATWILAFWAFKRRSR